MPVVCTGQKNVIQRLNNSNRSGTSVLLFGVWLLIFVPESVSKTPFAHTIKCTSWRLQPWNRTLPSPRQRNFIFSNFNYKWLLDMSTSHLWIHLDLYPQLFTFQKADLWPVLGPLQQVPVLQVNKLAGHPKPTGHNHYGSLTSTC